MLRRHRAIPLLILAILAACSSDPDAPNRQPSPPGPVPPPPESLSYHYVGAGGGNYAGVGEIELDVDRCDGYVFLADSTCLEFLLDGEPAPAEFVLPGSIIELLVDPDESIQPAWLDVQRTVVGPIESMDVPHARLTVLGQTVYITDVTIANGRIAPQGIADFAALMVDAIDTGTGSLTVMGFDVQTSAATHVSADSEPWVGSELFELADFAVGETVTVRGGTVENTIVSDRLARGGEANLIRARDYQLAAPVITLLGRSIDVNDATIVLDCGYYDDDCSAADADWLFDQSDSPPFSLLIEVDTSGERLRATRIHAYTT